MRVLSFLPTLEERGVDVESAVAAADLTLPEVVAGRGYLSWATYTKLADELYRGLPDDEAWVAIGAGALDSPALRVFALVASMFTNEVEAYGWWQRGFGPGSSFVPHLELDILQTGQRELEMVVRAPAGSAIPAVFRLAMKGAATRLPTLLRRPAAEVTMDHEPRRVRYRLRFAKGASLGHQALASVRSAMARLATDEVRRAHEALYEQNRILMDRMQQLADVEEQRAQLTTRLQGAERMEAIGRLAGGIAHDFNNVLTVIGGHAALLVEHPDEESHDHGEQIRDAVDQGARLVAQLLSFSRQRPEGREVLDVASLIDTMQPMLRSLVGDLHRLEMVLPEEPATVRFSRSHLEQVMMNLLANARDAVEGSGHIGVTVRRRHWTREHALRLPDAKPGDMVEIEVTDDGRGMTEETRQRCFEPFFTTKSDQHGGTGLGLATVYGLVRQADGFTEVDSRLGSGTTVRVSLPHCASPGLSTSRPTTPTSHRPAASNARILVVEDQPGVRSLLRRLLNRAGYRVTVASTPGEALALWQSAGPFDLLVTDVLMPELTGPQLAERLRALQRSLPVLFVSGYADAGVFDPNALPERSAFLSKPFTIDALHEIVHSLLIPG
jgi:signal transduction histidine kinase